MEFLRAVLEGYVDVLVGLNGDKVSLAVVRIGIFLIPLYFSVLLASRFFYTFKEIDGSHFYQPTARFPALIVGTLVGIIVADRFDKSSDPYYLAVFSLPALLAIFIFPYDLAKSLTGIISTRKNIRILFYIGLVVAFIVQQF